MSFISKTISMRFLFEFLFQVTEKQVLPSAEDLKAEKTHESLLQGVETFSPEKLNPTKTREPASATDGNFKSRSFVSDFEKSICFAVLKTEMAHTKSLDAVSKFDKNNLKNVDTQEKNPLPDPECEC